MKKYHRTTITIPQETYQKLKILTALQNKSVSAFIRDLIQKTISVNKKKIETFPFGKYELEVKDIAREKIYQTYFRKKISS
ncbi:MAG: ribbon-helix-helix protein, CopG family [Thermodesulfobacterium sp.]|nr:ribbon-helix-helix protein, CopG family [Thermodesulfobacterium sp.]